MKRPPHYLGGDLRDGKFLPVRHVLLPTDRGQYLQVHRQQVPLSRRMSHDEMDLFPPRSSPLLLRWSSSDDIRGGSSPVSPRRTHDAQHWSRRQPPRGEGEEGLTSLRQFLAGGITGSSGLGGGIPSSFFRDEITAFIDDTPCPSPIGTPHRSRPKPRNSPLPRKEAETGMTYGGVGERRLSLCSPSLAVSERRRASLSEQGCTGSS
ncbi:probable G-protein coupled receptor 162 [Bombina bombina]|nr:probable G-protein coupled receptor 162 [Bombina bombina]